LLSVPVSPTFPLQVATATGDVDVVHHHLPNPLSSLAGAIDRSDTPTVVTYHSDIVRQSRAMAVYRPLLEWFLDRAAQIIVTSPRLRDHSKVLGPYQDKCTVVPLSIDLESDGEVNDRWSELPVSPDDDLLLFVGRLNYYKGVSHLVEAMESVDADLLIIGDGDRRSSLVDQVETAGLAERVHFLGHVSEDLLQFCYQVADVFVLPSVEPSEAFGLVQIEAMVHETPVINTALPTGVPWVSQDGQTGLTVPPGDSDALAAAIDSLLQDETYRRELGRAARRRVHERFGRDRMLSDVEAVYEDVIA
jgi:rhamnosyl/mannosyltransferase